MTQAGNAYVFRYASMPEHYEDQPFVGEAPDRLMLVHDFIGSARYSAELPTKPLGI